MNKFFQLFFVLLLILVVNAFMSFPLLASPKFFGTLATQAQTLDILPQTTGSSSQAVFTTVLTSPHAFEPDISGQGVDAQAFGAPIPRTGDQKLLVILVDFSDRAGLFTGTDWQQRFFGSNGFADYYKEVSYNQLRYTGDVVGMSGGVPVTNNAGVSYVRLPNPLTYYADGNYGWKVGPAQFPKNHGGVVYHALQALDAAGFDFSPYADPTSKKVENLVVVFAGSTFATTSDAVNSLEATAFNLTWAGKGSAYTSSGGQIFNNYTVCPDQHGNLTGQLAFIGVCVHEHGHGLGMPDLYDYTYTTTGNGYFDLMAFGTFGNTGGERPFHLGPFSKEFYGWITPTIITSGTTTVTLGPAETGPNFLKLYPNDLPGSQEYFLLENRQPLGFDQDWLGTSLCAGLIIWHIDNSIVQNQDQFVNVNSLPPIVNAPAHQGVVVVEADGGYDMITPPTPLNYGDCGDTWAVGRTWDATSTPTSNLWNGSISNITVTVVSQVGNSVTLSITVTGLNLDKQTYLPIILK